MTRDEAETLLGEWVVLRKRLDQLDEGRKGVDGRLDEPAEGDIFNRVLDLSAAYYRQYTMLAEQIVTAMTGTPRKPAKRTKHSGDTL